MQLDRNTKLTTITAQLSSSKEQLRHAREMMLTERNNKERISEKLEVAERRIGELKLVVDCMGRLAMLMLWWSTRM